MRPWNSDGNGKALIYDLKEVLRSFQADEGGTKNPVRVSLGRESNGEKDGSVLQRISEGGDKKGGTRNLEGGCQRVSLPRVQLSRCQTPVRRGKDLETPAGEQDPAAPAAKGDWGIHEGKSADVLGERRRTGGRRSKSGTASNEGETGT